MNLVIKDGKIVDGTGNPWYKADIGIENGKIVKIGQLNDINSEILIDAKGFIVSPGFIDIHSHADATNFINPKQESTIRQGITTHIAGNCGYGLAPINPVRKDLVVKYLGDIVASSDQLKIEWETFNEYLSKVQESGIASNMMFLVGHGVIRIAAMGFENRDPTKSELEKMKNYVRESMESGALGLSTGLLYPPGIFAKTEEIIALCEIVAEYNGYYFSHIRSYGGQLMKSLKEAIKIGEKSGTRVQISHISVFGKPFWGSSDRVLQLLEKSRAKGIEVNTDLHPYDSVMTDLMILLPPWAYEGGKAKTLERLKDPEIREKIKHQQINGPENRDEWPEWAPIDLIGWDNILVILLKSEKYKKYEGKSIKDIADAENKDIYYALYDLLVEERAEANMIITHLRGEEDIINFMKSPLAAFETDATPTAPYGELSKGKPHPRGYGTYPKILGEYVREKSIINLEDAIRKSSSLPAQMVGIMDRGILKQQFWADIVIFNPNTIIDKATYTNPHQYPEGIEYVIINGEIVIEKGNHTEKLPGRVLRHQ